MVYHFLVEKFMNFKFQKVLQINNIFRRRLLNCAPCVLKNVLTCSLANLPRVLTCSRELLDRNCYRVLGLE